MLALDTIICITNGVIPGTKPMDIYAVPLKKREFSLLKDPSEDTLTWTKELIADWIISIRKIPNYGLISYTKTNSFYSS